MKDKKILCNQGFTLIELIIAMAISLVVMSAIFFTFKSQQDSYVVQTQVSATQQNIRAAMYMITRDLQMAGYLTSIANAYNMDWDDLGGPETSRPLIYTRNNMPAAPNDGVKDGTDLIVIVTVSGESRQLTGTEIISGSIILDAFRDFDGDTFDELNAENCGLLLTDDFNQADFFQVPAGTLPDTPINLATPLQGTYKEGDWLFKADVIIYYIDDEDNPADPNDNDDQSHPKLRRKALGPSSSGVVVAEDIDNLQFQYYLLGGTPGAPVSGLAAGQESLVRAVEVSVLARTGKINRGFTDTEIYNIGDAPAVPPNDGFRRKVLTSVIQTRNIGL